MSVCEVLKEEPCGASACDPVFSGGGSRRLVRREADVPKVGCWTDSLTAWMARTSRGTFADVADDAAVATLVEFFSVHPDLRSDMLFGAREDGTLQPLATRFHFESTFVEPQPQADTQEVVDEWDMATARLLREAPADLGIHMYSTGRWAPCALPAALCHCCGMAARRPPQWRLRAAHVSDCKTCGDHRRSCRMTEQIEWCWS